ncbi:MAG: DUF1844 domain-containing protein [Fimbriimonadales bacterium]|nr:DUF1844 domain-containing protein [Fimbriimonadales bacterium]
MSEERKEEASVPKEPISVFALLAVMVDQLASVAWQKLGLHPDPITGGLHRDLDEAKVAIDLVAHLSSLLEAKLDEEDRRRVHTLVRDLRLNFVEKAREEGR